MRKLLLLLLFVSFWAQGQEITYLTPNEGPHYIVNYNSGYTTWFESQSLLHISEPSCRENIRSQHWFSVGSTTYIENNQSKFFDYVRIGDVYYTLVGTEGTVGDPDYVFPRIGFDYQGYIRPPSTGHLEPDGSVSYNGNPGCNPTTGG